MTYNKVYTSDTNYYIEEVLANGRRREVSESQIDYVRWLNLGNTPNVIKWVKPPVITPPKPSLDDLKKAKIAEIEMAKWQLVNSGITFSGVPIATDAAGRELMNGAVTQVLIDPEYRCDWKINGRYLHLTSDMIKAVATAVRMHVQDAFDKERVLIANVNAAKNEADLAAIKWED